MDVREHPRSLPQSLTHPMPIHMYDHGEQTRCGKGRITRREDQCAMVGMYARCLETFHNKISESQLRLVCTVQTRLYNRCCCCRCYQLF